MLLLLLASGAVLGGAPLPVARGCLSTMATPAAWAPCRVGASPCWSFIPCALAGEYGLGGDGFVLLSVLGDGVGVTAPHWCLRRQRGGVHL